MPPDSVRPARLLIFCLLLPIIAQAMINRYGYLLGADVLLHSIMSLQKVTFFYWGQNRLVSLVPFLFSPIRDPWLNLWGILLFNACTFLLLLSTITVFLADRDKSPAVMGGVIALMLAFFSDQFFYSFSLGLPYSISYLSATVAGWITLRVKKEPLRWGGAFFLLSLAALLNPAVLIYVFLVSAWMWSTGRRGPAVLFFSLGAAGVLCSITASKFIGFGREHTRSYFTLNFKDFIGNLNLAAGAFLDAFKSGYHFLVCLVSPFLILALTRNGRYFKIAALLAGYGLSVFLALSKITWVIMGLTTRYNFRYFFPCYLILAVIIGMALHSVILRFSSRLGRVIIAFSILAFIAALAAPVGSIKSFPIFIETREYADLAEKEGIPFIAGDYWVVWPVVFQMLARGDQAAGVVYRGEQNRSHIRKLMAGKAEKRETVKALCLGPDLKVCLYDLGMNTYRDWIVDDTCGEKCSILIPRHQLHER